MRRPNCTSRGRGRVKLFAEKRNMNGTCRNEESQYIMTPGEVCRGMEGALHKDGLVLEWEKLKSCCRKVCIKTETRWLTGQGQRRTSPELKGSHVWIIALGQALSQTLPYVHWSSPPPSSPFLREQRSRPDLLEGAALAINCCPVSSSETGCEGIYIQSGGIGHLIIASLNWDVLWVQNTHCLLKTQQEKQYEIPQWSKW